MARLFCRDQIASEANGGFVRTLSLAIALAPLGMLIACGGSSNNAAPPPPPAQVRITVSPGTTNISVLDTQQFTATVTGSSNTGVTWSVVEQNGGSVDDTGKYTPPLRAGGYHVLATAQADTSKTAQAAVNVTAPAPVFSSTPASAALEQTLYSYDIAVTDPAGTAVTLALTTAPAGGDLSGSTLTWTPTPAQSRVANNFVVTASSDAGGSATQSWSVTPAGTIHGSIIDVYWNSSGSTLSPYDLTQQPIAALVPQPDGSVQLLSGVGNSDGTFTIPNVPGGYYWLQAGWLYWTDSSTFDAGVDYSGRPWSPAIDTTASFNLTGSIPGRPVGSSSYRLLTAESFAISGRVDW